MAAGGVFGVVIVRLSLGRAASPTLKMAWRSSTWKLVSVDVGLPPRSRSTCARQIPALSKPASVTYTPLGPDGDTASGAFFEASTGAPGVAMNVAFCGEPSWHGPSA